MLVSVERRVRLQPEHPPSIPSEIGLSILDSSVANFSPTAGAWIFDKPSSGHGLRALSPDHLISAFRNTLNAYPQWAGQLKLAPPDSDAHSAALVVFLSVPTSEERGAGSGCFDSKQLSSLQLLPTSPQLALYDMEDFEGLPVMIVQLTLFDCGGIAIAVKLAHPMADARSMTTFVKDWASVGRALLHDEPPQLDAVFHPTLIDQAAGGNIDAPIQDEALIKTSRSLPVNRYDCWISGGDDCPEMIRRVTKIPSSFGVKSVTAMGIPLPWKEWDISAPVEYFLVHFTPDEVTRMWEDASSSASGKISRFDALQAHVWSLIIRARGPVDNEAFHLNITLGLRNRLSPPLPESFIGSPVIVACVKGDMRMSIGSLASGIRNTLTQFTFSTLAALLHDMAYVDTPQRMWVAFFGRRNCVVTSWLRLGVYDVDFGGGLPRHVEAFMPSMDGCIQVMEGGASGNEDQPGGKAGVSVSLHLKADVMRKLLDDPWLRKYRFF